MRWTIDRRRRLLLAALLLAGLWLPGISTGPSLATALSTVPDDAQSPRPQPAPPGRKVKLEASETDVPTGRVVKLTARADRSEDEAFVITIRREAGHLGSGLEATCKSQAVCTVDVREGRPSAKRFAAALYRCDQQGVCRLEEDATESDKVRVNWR
jgi:hypothetical protein